MAALAAQKVTRITSPKLTPIQEAFGLAFDDYKARQAGLQEVKPGDLVAVLYSYPYPHGGKVALLRVVKIHRGKIHTQRGHKFDARTGAQVPKPKTSRGVGVGAYPVTPAVLAWFELKEGVK